ncbi:hypothetical protein ACH5RR_010007 [Cinchona calisaya]|uniref:HMA domain-containing protein n=1 Tax=Cinchona calisaya TaxID=153742 RepID=A0ABD3AIA8_9GENT
MKSVELLCASPASTAICASTNQRSMVRQGGIKPTDRHGEHHHSHRHKTRPQIPCSSHPISPCRPYFDKNGKTTSSPNKQNPEYLRRKSSADITKDQCNPFPNQSSRFSRDTPLLDILSDSEHSSSALVSKSARHPDFNDHPVFRSSSSALVSKSARHPDFNDHPVLRSSMSRSTHSYDNPVYEFSSSLNDDFHAKKSSLSSLISNDLHALKSSSFSRMITSHASKSSLICSNESHAYKSPSGREKTRHQVVELRVSIHCKGCEGKLRKHISKMEGVTSYTIDLDRKKVTVIGNVTPQGVLTSISKVKNAELWSSPTTSSSSSSPTVYKSLVST